MRLVFWGTPATAVPFLEYLCAHEDVAGVVTQTDKPSMRGQEVHKTPVKILAEEKKLTVLQPSKLKDPEFLSKLAELKPEAGIVIAYGRIIPVEAINIFPKGLYNIHFSLLPHLKGAAPMQWAIVRGDKETGVTSFRIEESLDSGNILVKKPLSISGSDDAVSLEKKMISLGLDVLKETLEHIKGRDPTGIPQKGEETYAPIIKKSDAKIDWERSAEEIERMVRGFIQTGVFCITPVGKHLKVTRSENVLEIQPDKEILPSGTLCKIEKGRGFLIRCKKGYLRVLRVQMEGKKETDAWSFLQGARLKVGDRFE